MKRIECGALVPGCDFKAQAPSDAEVLSVELDHARRAHDINVTPQFLQRARDQIQEVAMEPAAKVRGRARRRG